MPINGLLQEADTKIKQILLIDDDSDEHVFFSSALKNFNSNINCITAFNCTEGYQLAKEKKPDIVFLDMNLPGTNGLICLRKFKKTSSLQDVPVFMYSGGIVTDKEIVLALQSGAKKWISKPRKFEDYNKMFSRCLN